MKIYGSLLYFGILLLLFLSLQGSASLYFTDNGQRLDRLISKSIRSTKSSLFIQIYTFNENLIREEINHLLKKGQSVSIYQPKNQSLNLISSPLLEKKQANHCTGLMHKKLLIIDEFFCHLGSANFTRNSLVSHLNTWACLPSYELAHTIRAKKAHHTFTVGSQLIEYFETPRDQKIALNRIVELIKSAQKSLKIAMYTLTHQNLTQTVIKAHQKGIAVKVYVDMRSAKGTSKKCVQQLQEAGVPTFFPLGVEMTHHKTCEIDGKHLIMGSLNWTESAFKRNEESLLFLYDLDKQQKKELHKMWKRLYARSTSSLVSKAHLLSF